MTTIKRKALSLQEKLRILEIYDENSENKTQTQLATELQLPVSTLRTIIKNREVIKKRRKLGGILRKKQKVGKYDKLENVLIKWLEQVRALSLPINGRLLCEKAREIAEDLQIPDFKATNGWIDRFKNRHGIIYRQQKVAVTKVKETIQKNLLLLENYEPQDIFNADEFGLLYKIMANKSHVYVKESYRDVKASTERLTVLACTNSDGSQKLPLLVIGKTQNPDCLRNVRTLPVSYNGQPQAWITRDHFIDWLKTLDDYLQTECRQIILLIDSCPAHPGNVELRNIKLVILPHSESKLQPMLQGIIKTLKQGYRTRLIHKYLSEIENPDYKRSLDVHDAILYLAAAWEEVKPEIIQNSFQKAGFCTENTVFEESEPTILQNFPGYSSVDDDIATCFSSLEEEPYRYQNASLDDEKEDVTPIMSNAQAFSAVAELRRYLSSIDKSEDAMQKLNYIENIVMKNASIPPSM